MSEPKGNEYTVGFKKPPRHTRFKPGHSGNPKGRPKKINTVADVIQKELNRRITVVKDGIRKRVPLLQLIVTQNLNLAAKGDSKAFSNFLKAVKTHPPASGDNLGALVQEWRAIHERRKAADHERDKVSEIEGRNCTTRKERGLSKPRKDKE